MQLALIPGEGDGARVVDDLLSRQAFFRRMCGTASGSGVDTSNEAALKEALIELLDDDVPANALDCGLNEDNRDHGDECRNPKYGKCAECRVHEAKKEADCGLDEHERKADKVCAWDDGTCGACQLFEAIMAHDCGLSDPRRGVAAPCLSSNAPCAKCRMAEDERAHDDTIESLETKLADAAETIEGLRAAAPDADGATRIGQVDQSEALEEALQRAEAAEADAADARAVEQRARDDRAAQFERAERAEAALAAAMVPTTTKPKRVRADPPGTVSLFDLMATTTTRPTAEPAHAWPNVASAAAVRRLPAGTKLRLVKTMMGPCDTGRVVVRATSDAVEMRVDDTTSKNHGELSTLQLKGSKVEPRDNGFAIVDDGQLCAEYVFA